MRSLVIAVLAVSFLSGPTDSVVESLFPLVALNETPEPQPKPPPCTTPHPTEEPTPIGVATKPNATVTPTPIIIPTNTPFIPTATWTPVNPLQAEINAAVQATLEAGWCDCGD